MVAEVSTGKPCWSQAFRPTWSPWGPNCATHPAITFSTWLGKPGVYLEDLFVRPELRARGIGKAMMIELARIAVREGCGRFEWSVLDWNQPSIDFYRSLGARLMEEWVVCRLEGEALRSLAGREGQVR